MSKAILNPTATHAVIAALALCAGVAAADPLFSNASTDPSVPALSSGGATASGVPSPLGGLWSELQGDGLGAYNAVAGFSAHQLTGGGAYRLSDEFSLTNIYGWHLNTVTVFAYTPPTLGGGAGSPVASANLRIWSGPPDSGASSVVFGDTATNRVLAATATNYYRVFNSAALSPVPPAADRQIWAITLDVSGANLAPGTYWLDWQFVPAAGVSAVFSPTAWATGLRTKAGWDAKQFRTLQGVAPGASPAWAGALDEGRPAISADLAQDIAFMIDGVSFCPADFDGSGGTPDAADIVAFFNAWLAGDPSADVDLSGGTPDTQDIDAFFALWLAGGC